MASGGIGGHPLAVPIDHPCEGDGGCCAQFGLFADRPSANTVPPGTQYIATDTGDKYISDGTTWYQYGVGGTSFSFTTPQVIATGAAYSALLTDRVIMLNSNAMTVFLPAAPTADTLYHIKDYTDAASGGPAFAHIITPFGPQTIDHVAAGFPVDQDSMNVTLGYNPTDDNWMVL